MRSTQKFLPDYVISGVQFILEQYPPETKQKKCLDWQLYKPSLWIAYLHPINMSVFDSCCFAAVVEGLLIIPDEAH